ncbi:hypothetical protein [Peribacillus kribbensis]|uniref:hypothetical protein n=1 Tax=Peribacillus kribbensis TaxID=356658 RepID=UPI000426C19F|nr:hypothetical protein [Peribacillus kribbensis]
MLAHGPHEQILDFEGRLFRRIRGKAVLDTVNSKEVDFTSRETKNIEKKKLPLLLVGKKNDLGLAYAGGPESSP